MKRADIYKNFKGGLVQGLLYERGLFDSSPSLNLLKKEITKAPQRKLNIGTCNLRTGNLVRYHENLTVPNLIEAALASGSVPTFFPYSTFDDEIYVDGGTVRRREIYKFLKEKIDKFKNSPSCKIQNRNILLHKLSEIQSIINSSRINPIN